MNATDTVAWMDLTRQYRSLRDEMLGVLDDCMACGAFILGPYVERFEAEFARWVGARHCVGLNSGTSALHLALLACGVAPGDEVITVPATWISTTWAVSYAGARPVYVDIDPATYGMDPERIEAAITPRTRAILPVHLYGQPCDMTEILRIADRHGVVVIEDAAQAHGATLGGRYAGTFGRAGCFSFYPGKNLGAYGESGAVVTDDDQLAARIRRLRDHAQLSRHVHNELGYNMRMEGVQGAVLGVKLPHLSGWIAARRGVAERYQAAWRGLDGLKLPAVRPGAAHAWHIYALCCEDRGDLARYAAEHGVQTSVHYPTPVHLQPAYEHLGYRRGDFPVSEWLFGAELTMPLYPELTDEEVCRVIDVVCQWSAARAPAGCAA